MFPNAEVVGHSLGGGLASAFGTKHGRKTSTFNSAGLHPDTLAAYGINRSDAKNRVEAHYVYGEILSTGQDIAGPGYFDSTPLLNRHPVLTVAPGAVGNRTGYVPDLENNDVSWQNFTPGISVNRNLKLSGSLHGIDEMIEALERAKSNKCCP